MLNLSQFENDARVSLTWPAKLCDLGLALNR